MLTSHLYTATVARFTLSARVCLAVAIITAMVGLGTAQTAHAQFIQTTMYGGYQSADGKVKVSVTNQEGAQGILIVHLSQPIAPQEFNLEKIPTTGTSHIFVRFDPNAEFPYSEILIGERVYRLSGNLNLVVGEAHVQIDNTNPYLTVSYRSGEKPVESIVGFYGLVEVVKGGGTLAAIVGANQHGPEIAKILKPYNAKGEALWLDDKRVDNPSVGIFVRHEHVCLNESSSILTLDQLKRIQSIKVEAQQVQVLDGYLKGNKRASPLSGKLVLRADPQSPLVLLDMTQNVYDLRQIKNLFSKNVVCVLSPIT